MTFRGRLLATSILALAVGLGALLVAGNAVLRARADAELASLAHARAETQIAALDVRGGHVALRESANDRVLDREAWVFDGDRVIERPPGVGAAVERTAIRLGRAGGPASASARRDERLQAEPILAGGRRIGAVVVGISTAPVERLEGSVLVGSLALAAILLLAGWWVIRAAVDGALRPVARMTNEAADWSAHDLDRRFGLGPPRDELSALAATLDRLLARIAASRRHEQRFASEVAHELRTPIARIRGRAELALRAGPGADAEQTAALETVVADVDRLTTAIDALLAMARSEADPGGESVDVAAIARETDAVEVDAPPDLPRAEGDAEVVRRAIAPLVENAHRHARDRVWLELSASSGRVRVAVRDDGPGVDADLGERVFEPGVRGTGASGGGAGLGLALARRMARACGGDVTIGPGPGGCFVLELPVVDGTS
jgi:signal transduction histidine kinase